MDPSRSRLISAVGERGELEPGKNSRFPLPPPPLESLLKVMIRVALSLGPAAKIVTSYA